MIRELVQDTGSDHSVYFLVVLGALSYSQPNEVKLHPANPNYLLGCE